MGQYYGSETVDNILCGNGAGMYQFFVDEQQVQQDQIVITGQDVNHIGNVLRMKPGEKVRISDSNENSYFCRIAEIAEDEVIAVIEEKDELGTEFAHKVFLFQGLPKSDKMELIIQSFLDDQSDSFEKYIPEETKRISNAVLEQKGKYVVLCVSGDSDKAKEIIEKAFK